MPVIYPGTLILNYKSSNITIKFDDILTDPAFGRNCNKNYYFFQLCLSASAGFKAIGPPDSAPACEYSSFYTLDRFDKVVVFMATGQYNASLPPAEGDLAVWYHKTIMGRNDTEIQAEKEAAMKDFEDEFGPGLPEPVAFGADPRNGHDQ